MNPDGLSYLEIASNTVAGGPSNLVNGYWSPGYPAVISLAIILFHPSPENEFPLVHAVNFLIFILTLWFFSFFLRSWFDSVFGNVAEGTNWKSIVMPFAFCTFLWATMTFIGTANVTPDLGVAAIIFLAAALGCRLSLSKPGWAHAAALGFVLGVGYYLKAAMFPLALLYFLLLFVLLPVSGRIRRREASVLVMVACLVFLLVAAPLVSIMSVRANTLSFGETGRLNYAWFATGVQWAGGVEHPGINETVDHPAPKLQAPPVTLVFASPIPGTYPLWYDPSYWYGNLKVRFDFRKQIGAVMTTLGVYKQLALDMMALISGAIVLGAFAISHPVKLIELRRGLWLMAWPLAACSMYAVVYVEPRYVGGFLVLFWLAVYGGLMLQVDRRVAAAISATAVCTLMVPFTSHLGKESVRIATELVYPRSPEYQIAGIGLRNLGLGKGDRLAVVGYSYDCYYAHYDGLRVVAQIPSVTEFWRLNTAELKSLSERLGALGVKAIVASKKPDWVAEGEWPLIREIKVSDSAKLYVLALSSEPVTKMP